MKINHKQLTFAREYRGYSQTQLSSSIYGLSQSNLSKFEKGLNTLSNELLSTIMEFLEFPVQFLSTRISNESSTAHYRKKTTITLKDRTDIEQSYKLIGYLVDQMSEALVWPDYNFRSWDLENGFTPKSIAQHTRKFLGLKPDEPVQDICNLLESNGIIIIEFDSIEKFDGVSFVSDEGFAIIVMNKNVSNDRKRFTIAHELGHLLMHAVDDPAIPDKRILQLENEANQFAGEFLMPESSIRNSLFDLKISYLAELKRYWLTSMTSIVRRAKDLGCISNDTYTYINTEFSRRGLRKDEGLDVFIDSPALFRKGYLMHKNDLEFSDHELASAFAIPEDVIKRFCGPNRTNSKLRVIT